MSLLSGNQFADKGAGGGADIPRMVLISRMLLWIQAVLGILLSGFVLWLSYQQQQLSDAELAKLFKEQLGAKEYKKQYGDNPPTQDMFDHTAVYLLAGLLIVVMVVLIVCALRLTGRQKAVRYTVVAAEALLVPVSMLGLYQIGCVLALPAIAVIGMMLTRPVKDWYAAAPADG